VHGFPEADVHPLGESGDHAGVASVGQVAEIVPLILQIVPHPAKRLLVAGVRALCLDHRVQCLAGPPTGGAAQLRPSQEGIDGVGHGCTGAELHQ
jgi:hypothetical protein